MVWRKYIYIFSIPCVVIFVIIKSLCAQSTSNADNILLLPSIRNCFLVFHDSLYMILRTFVCVHLRTDCIPLFTTYVWCYEWRTESLCLLILLTLDQHLKPKKRTIPEEQDAYVCATMALHDWWNEVTALKREGKLRCERFEDVCIVPSFKTREEKNIWFFKLMKLLSSFHSSAGSRWISETAFNLWKCPSVCCIHLNLLSIHIIMRCVLTYGTILDLQLALRYGC